MIRSFKVLIAGLVILGFSVAILFANSADRAETIADELIEVTSVSPENEGRLVMLSGTPELANGGVIVDEEAGLQVENTVYYSRVPYQKVYSLKKREVVVDQGEDKYSEADDITEIEYYIAEEWIVANSERDEVVTRMFERYENPPKLPLSAYHASGDLRIAGFRVSAADVYDHLQTKIESFTPSELQEACGSYIVRSELNLQPVLNEYGRGMLSSGDKIGDVHVRFSYETLEGADPVTIIGRQRGEAIVLEDDDLVSESERVQAGIVSKEAFMASITKEDASSRKIGVIGLVLSAIVLLLSLNWSGLLGKK
jgi:hypothetical protein